MKTRIFGILLILLFITGCAQLPSRQAEVEMPELPKVSSAFAAKYAIYAMIASNTYHKDESERVHFPVDMLGWRLVDKNDNPTTEPTGNSITGLSWDIYENTRSSEVIFSFRGTDSYLDYLTASAMPWPLAIQYQQSRSAFEDYRENHPNKEITLTGHSLGGGLASGISVREGVNVVIFDPSPRIFDGWRDKHKPAKERVVIYQKGEVLIQARKYWPKLVRTFKPTDFYETNFDFGKFSPHRMDQLALGLLILGSKEKDSGLSAVLEETRQKLSSQADLEAAKVSDE